MTTDAIDEYEFEIRKDEVSIRREVAQMLRNAARDWDFESDEYRVALKRVADAMDPHGKPTGQGEGRSRYIL